MLAKIDRLKRIVAWLTLALVVVTTGAWWTIARQRDLIAQLEGRRWHDKASANATVVSCRAAYDKKMAEVEELKQKLQKFEGGVVCTTAE